MQYSKATKFSKAFLKENIMGPNPAKLLEQLLSAYPLAKGKTVLDLGCGRGVTSVLLAKEYELRVFAADLWIDATDNFRRFRQFGLTDREIIPIHAEAHDLPFAQEFFDAVVSVDSYHYFGLERDYLGKHLLPLVKRGGLLLFVVPGFHKDVHNDIPKELLLSWSPEDLDTLHDATYWRNILLATDGVEILSIREMEDFDECWAEWLETENEYAARDRAAMGAGAGNYMNFLAIALKRT